MTSQPTPEALKAEDRIRRSLVFIRFFVGYMPTNIMRWLENLSTNQFPINSRVRTESITADGVPCEWFDASANASHPVVLYLHGGGFVLGVSGPHRTMLADLTASIEGRALMVDYRLAPEHPFPAPLEDCLTAYRWLLKQGILPERIIVGGDSAGGNLTLALLLSLRDSGEPLPAAGICLSPPVDLTPRSPAYLRDHPDDILHPRALVKFRKSYVADNDPLNPLISPIYADLSKLPPLLIYAGSQEVLCEDADRLAQAAKKVGTSVDLRIYPRMWHVWQLTGSSLPQAAQSLDEIAAFIRQTQSY